jgi:hypothetical protein
MASAERQSGPRYARQVIRLERPRGPRIGPLPDVGSTPQQLARLIREVPPADRAFEGWRSVIAIDLVLVTFNQRSELMLSELQRRIAAAVLADAYLDAIEATIISPAPIDEDRSLLCGCMPRSC